MCTSLSELTIADVLEPLPLHGELLVAPCECIVFRPADEPALPVELEPVCPVHAYGRSTVARLIEHQRHERPVVHT